MIMFILVMFLTMAYFEKTTSATAASCQTRLGEECIFPFTYGGVTYDKCTEKDEWKPWCPTFINGTGYIEDWGWCSPSCSQARFIKSPRESTIWYKEDYVGHTITVNENSKIELNFLNFDLKNQTNCKDAVVIVSDGDGSLLLEKYCDEVPVKLVSKTNMIVVTINSSGDTKVGGFEAEWNEIGEEQWFYIRSPSSNNDTVTIADDGGLVVDSMVGGSNQLWRFNDGVLLSNTGQVADMSECLHAEGVQVQTWHRHGGQNQQFRMDNYTVQDAYNLVFEVTDNNEVILARRAEQEDKQAFKFDAANSGDNPTSGVITSPNYPNNYENNFESYYQITVNEGSYIKLTFTDVDVEYHEGDGCYYEYITVMDGWNTLLLEESCNISSMGDPIFSMTNQISVFFKTDESSPYSGWRAEWEEMNGV